MPSVTMTNVHYVHVLYNAANAEVKTVTNQYRTFEPPTGSQLLKSYKVDADGGMTLIDGPERTFIARDSYNHQIRPHDPRGIDGWNWNGSHYWEVMPDGSYRKLSAQEISLFRAEYVARQEAQGF